MHITTLSQREQFVAAVNYPGQRLAVSSGGTWAPWWKRGLAQMRAAGPAQKGDRANSNCSSPGVVLGFQDASPRARRMAGTGGGWQSGAAPAADGKAALPPCLVGGPHLFHQSAAAEGWHSALPMTPGHRPPDPFSGSRDAAGTAATQGLVRTRGQHGGCTGAAAGRQRRRRGRQGAVKQGAISERRGVAMP